LLSNDVSCHLDSNDCLEGRRELALKTHVGVQIQHNTTVNQKKETRITQKRIRWVDSVLGFAFFIDPKCVGLIMTASHGASVLPTR
jgi:hypothetical protein